MATPIKTVGLVLLFLLAGAPLVGTGLAQLELSHAELVYQGPHTLSLFNRPDGAGKPFTEAYLPGGSGIVDGTIVLTLIDWFGLPVANYPRVDMWIRSVDGGMVACNGAAIADRDTDGAGQTVWAEPLFAGGHSETLCQVMIGGSALTSSAGLNLHFNSPDLNGDGLVNIQDVGFFVSHLFGPYDYASDFNHDGVINISDAGMMALALGAACP